MLESNDNDSNVIRGMMRKGVFQELGAGLLCIGNVTHKVDCALIVSNVPELIKIS
jgi:hypothetical protein